MADLWWLHSGQERAITAVVLPDLQTHWRYHYVAVGQRETGESIQSKLRAGGRVIIARYDGPHVSVYDAGELEDEGQSPATRFVANFDGRMALLSYSWAKQEQDLRVELRWQCWEQIDQDTTVFLHLYNEAGQLVAQADGYPLMGAAWLIAWRPGDEWRDVRVLSLPEGLPMSQYALKVGLYPSGGDSRLAALGPEGIRFQDDAVPIATLSLP